MSSPLVPASPSPAVPPLRPDLHAAARDGGVIVTDSRTGRRTQLGVQSAAIWAALSAGQRTPTALIAALPHLRPEVIRGRLLQLAQSGLLAEAVVPDPESPARGAGAAAGGAAPAVTGTTTPAADAVTPSVRVDALLRHRCLGCGSSCVGVVIAPVTAPTFAALTAHPLPGVARPVVDAGGLPGLAREAEGCVALTPDARCAIHATSGAAAKPDPCRLFPYFLVRTPRGLRAGLGAECRSLPGALQLGEAADVKEISAELEALSDYAAHLPDPALLWPELPWSAAQLETAADAWLATPDPLAAAVAAVSAARDGLQLPPRPWLDLAAWPGAALPTRVDAQRGLLQALVDAAAATADDATQRNELFAAERAVLVGKAAQVLAGEVVLPRTRLDAEAAPVLAAAARGALAGLEFAVRRDVAWGLGRLRLHLALAQTLAAVRAAQVARVAVRSQDMVDGLVACSMFLRSPRAEAVLGLHAPAVRGCWLAPEQLAEPWDDAFGAPA